MLHSTRHGLLRVLPLLLFGWLLACGQVNAQEQTLTVTGMAQIVDGNTLAARDAALRDAMRKAVETGLGTLLESRTLVENFALVNDQIYSNAQGFVSSHEVLDEKEEYGSYLMTIRATVNRDQLGKDARALGLLEDLMGKPKMMILLDEYWWDPGVPADQQTPVSDPASGARLAEKLLERGFSLVDAATARQLRATEMLMMDDLMASGEAIARIAQKAAADYGAEILILGSCKAEPVDQTAGRYTAASTLDVRIVDAATADLLGAKQYSQTGVGSSPEQARSESARRAGDGASSVLIDQVLQFWQDKANNGIEFMVKLYQVDSFVQQGMRFIKELKGVSGVTQARRRSWDEKLGRLEVALTYKGADADELTYAIVERLMDKPGFENLELRESKGNNLNFYLK